MIHTEHQNPVQMRQAYMAAGKANTARRYRLYPSPAQAERLIEWGHTCRAVWNVALEQRQFMWTQRRHGAPGRTR